MTEKGRNIDCEGVVKGLKHLFIVANNILKETTVGTVVAFIVSVTAQRQYIPYTSTAHSNIMTDQTCHRVS